MSEQERCKYCDTPFGDDRDKNGQPFCSCVEAQNDQLHVLLNEVMKLVMQYRHELLEAKQYNHLFSDAMHRGFRMYMDEHPDSNIWPDAGINIQWLLEKIDTLSKTMVAMQTKRQEEIKEDLSLPRFTSRKELEPPIPGMYLCYYEQNGCMEIFKLDGVTKSENAFTHWLYLTDPIATLVDKDWSIG